MIEFFIKASPTYKKNVATKQVIMTPMIQECFRFVSPVTKTASEGVVDEDIRKENKLAYDAFKTLLEAQQDDLYASALASMGVEFKPVEEKLVEPVQVYEAPVTIELKEEMVVVDDLA